MKKQTLVVLAAVVTLAGPAFAQGRTGPGFDSVMTRLFGDNKQFSADVDINANTSQGEMSMPGKMYSDSGKTRFEMNIGDAKGTQIQPGMVQQMKTMGMDKTVAISRPDSKTVYVIYPGLSAYLENPSRDPDAGKPDSAFKTDKTELGKETVDGHVCVKNKVVITDDKGQKHESTVWNATDMKDFPVKIQTSENGNDATLVFKNIKLAKPDAALFEPPAGYKKYTNQRDLLQQEMMKRMPGMQPGGAPGGATPTHP